MREDKPPLEDANARERAAMAWSLRVTGYTYAQIAERCGYANPSSARKACNRYRQNLEIADKREVIAVQSMRIERAILACMDWIETQPAKDRLWAVDRLAPLLKRQAELLGLDAKADAPESGTTISIVVPGAEAV